MVSNASSASGSSSFGGFSSSGASMDAKAMTVVGNKIWEHGISLDKDNRKIRCRYCDEIITGGVYTFMQHLAGTGMGIVACGSASDEALDEIGAESQKDLEACNCNCMCASDEETEETVADLQVKKPSIDEERFVGVGKKRKGKEVVVGSSGNVFKKRRTSSEATLKENLREEACHAIARFFYNNAINLDAAKSDEFIEMCHSISRHGLRFTPPSLDEIKGKYLKEEVAFTMEALEEHRAVWKTTGCSIMADGWTDIKSRSIVNFLVNSPKGTFFLKSIDVSLISKTAEKLFKMMDDIVEEVGEENVVQIVTDNTTNYKAAGKMLMEKRARLYWTPCATHSIEMILEDFEKKIPIHEETIRKGKRIINYIYSRSSLISQLHDFTKGKHLVKQGITCCATSYLTLGHLHENKGALTRMFTSKEWKSSRFAKTRFGKYVEDVVLDKEFWKNVIICVKGAYPIIEVLRLFNLHGEPAMMGFIYGVMEIAKETIRRSLSNGVVESFMPLWDIIDERWDSDSPLHAAGYFLNPQLHYHPVLRADVKVKHHLYRAIARMVADRKEQAKIDRQLDDFIKQANYLGLPSAITAAHEEVPSNWWESYRDEYPELQKFAVRVLNLTCSSFGGERNHNAFEMNWNVRGNAVGVRIIVSSNSQSQISIRTKNGSLLWSAKAMMLLGSKALIMLMVGISMSQVWLNKRMGRKESWFHLSVRH